MVASALLVAPVYGVFVAELCGEGTIAGVAVYELPMREEGGVLLVREGPKGDVAAMKGLGLQDGRPDALPELAGVAAAPRCLDSPVLAAPGGALVMFTLAEAWRCDGCRPLVTNPPPPATGLLVGLGAVPGTAGSGCTPSSGGRG